MLGLEEQETEKTQNSKFSKEGWRLALNELSKILSGAKVHGQAMYYSGDLLSLVFQAAGILQSLDLSESSALLVGEERPKTMNAIASLAMKFQFPDSSYEIRLRWTGSLFVRPRCWSWLNGKFYQPQTIGCQSLSPVSSRLEIWNGTRKRVLRSSSISVVCGPLPWRCFKVKAVKDEHDDWPPLTLPLAVMRLARWDNSHFQFQS